MTFIELKVTDSFKKVTVFSKNVTFFILKSDRKYTKVTVLVMLSIEDTYAKISELDAIEQGWEEERKQMEETIERLGKEREDFFRKKPDLFATIAALQRELAKLEKNPPKRIELPPPEIKKEDITPKKEPEQPKKEIPPPQIPPPKEEPKPEIPLPQIQEPAPIQAAPPVQEKVEDKVLKDIQVEAPKSAKKGKKPLKKKSSKSTAKESPEEQDPTKFEYGVKYTLVHHVDSVRAVVFHPTQPFVASASDDGTLRFTNILFKLPKRVPSPKQYMSIRAKDTPILALAAKGNSLYTGCLDGTIQQFDFGKGDEDIFAVHGRADHHLINSFEAGEAVWSVAAHEKAAYIVAVCADKTIRILAADTLEQLHCVNTESAPTSAAFDENGEKYTVGCQDGTLLIMNKDQIQEKKKFAEFIYCVTAYNGGFAVGLESGKLSFTDGDDIQAHSEPISCLCTLGGALISGSHDCYVKAFLDGEQKLSERVSEKKFGEGVLSVAASDSMFVAATSDSNLKVFVRSK